MSKSRRLSVLISAYACEPGKGSELGIGWGTVRALSDLHDVWVLTRAANRPAIDAELELHSAPGLKFIYYDLPKWACWWKKGGRGVQLYYLLWQTGVRQVVKKLLISQKYDICHHLTWGRCWMPCAFYLSPVPYIFGPAGGVEKTPPSVFSTLSKLEQLKEKFRDISIRLFSTFASVRKSLKKAACVLATSEDAVRYARSCGAKNVRLLTNSGISRQDYFLLAKASPPPPSPVRFISMGRLVAWKGFHLGLEAFSNFSSETAEYWVVGDGPERQKLECQAKRLGISGRVKFFGWVDRAIGLKLLEQCHVLVHPSFHDSGGLVCAEAMAARRPVICLDAGGPAVQVSKKSGYIIDCRSKEAVISSIADSMRILAEDEKLCRIMGASGQRDVFDKLTWEARAQELSAIYFSILESV